jgi:hypothetical protein
MTRFMAVRELDVSARDVRFCYLLSRGCTQRPFLVAVLLLLLLSRTFAAAQATDTAAAASVATNSRNWSKYPAVVEVDSFEQIVAVGDVHGDYERLVKVLVAAGIIKDEPNKPEEVEWSAGKTTFVCTGDLIDKGKHSLKVIALFRALKESAEKLGGEVIVTMGNHEAEFLADPKDDEKAEVFLRELDKAGLDPASIAAGTDENGIGAYLQNLPFAARIGDWFFAHAGNTFGQSLEQLRESIEQGVSDDGFGAAVLLSDNSLLEARLHPRPWWERKDESPEKSQERLSRFLKALGVRHLVIGHQPGKAVFSDGTKRKRGEMVQKFDGRIFLIDVGMSKAIDDSEGAALTVRRKSDRLIAEAVYPDGSVERLWSEH